MHTGERVRTSCALRAFRDHVPQRARACWANLTRGFISEIRADGARKIGLQPSLPPFDISRGPKPLTRRLEHGQSLRIHRPHNLSLHGVVDSEALIECMDVGSEFR